MQALFESLAILFVLFLMLRVSLTRPRDALRLRGGLVTLNILTGALVGGAAGLALGGDAAAGAPGPAVNADPSASAATAYAVLGRAILHVLPWMGLLLGGLAGHLLFGALWRRYLRSGPASARAWLRRAQFLACLAAIVFLVRRLL